MTNMSIGGKRSEKKILEPWIISLNDLFTVVKFSILTLKQNIVLLLVDFLKKNNGFIINLFHFVYKQC